MASSAASTGGQSEEKEENANKQESTHPTAVTTKHSATDCSALLQQAFLYHNRSTGKPSTTPLSVRQVCRMLCPGPPSQAVFPVDPSTHVISYDPSTGAYDAQGWRPARTVPILREACATWHLTTTTATAMTGPVTCRQLSEVASTVSRVWSPEMANAGVCNEWKRPCDLPHLSAALLAFGEEEVEPPAAHTTDAESNVMARGAQRELEAFLSGKTTAMNDGDKEVDLEEQYESDGGTVYLRDSKTSNWIPLTPAQLQKREEEARRRAAEQQSEAQTKNKKNPNKKKRKAAFKARNAKCWIYVTGLPPDTNAEEVAKYFSKVGILDLDPETQKPKVKLYRQKTTASNSDDADPQPNQLKGDASICYARPESVELALQILDDSVFGKDHRITVERAKFEQHGDYDASKRWVSNTKRKRVAKLAALQAVGWDEGDNGRLTGGRKGLRIVVLKHMFDPAQFASDEGEDAVLAAVEQTIRQECASWPAVVEKITCFAQNVQGVVIVKFANPTHASRAVSEFQGRPQLQGGPVVEASFWDGATDFSVEEPEETKRLDEFGDWLDNQQVPDEFQLQVEGGD